MKKKLIAGMTSTALIASIGAPAFAANFSDVNGHWAASTINKLADAGIINGMDASNFAPEGTLTRAQFAKLVALGLGLNTSSSTSSFSDVSGWAIGYVEAAKDAGIIKGTDATHFNPNGIITREEAAAIMVRALSSKATLEAGTDINFPDAGQVSSWFKAEVATAIKYQLLQGKDGNLAPKGNSTRAEAAILTERLMNKVTELTAVKPFAVQKVEALNASQLKVTFTQAVDKTSAQLNSSYVLTNATLSAAYLQDDAKSVILNLSSPITTKTTVAVTVKDVQLKEDPSQVVPVYSTTLVVEDKVAPSIVSVTSVTNSSTATTAEVQFSEPVKAGATFKVDGTTYAATPVLDANQQLTKVKLAGLSLDASKSHNLQVVGLLDTADNTINPNPTDITFTVTKDVVAPTVANVEARGDNKIVVTFSKKVDPATVSASVYNETFGSVTTGAIVAVPTAEDNTGTKFIIPVDPGYSLYSGTTTSRTLTVLFADNVITDTAGNKLATTTKSVTLTKDTTAPQVASVSYKKDANGYVTSIVANYNEELTPNSSVNASNITIVDANGVLVSNINASVLNNGTVAANSKTVEFTLSPAVKITGAYTFNLPKGLVKDAAQTPNDSAAYSAAINFGSASAAELTVSSVTYGNVSTPNTFTVTFSDVVKGGNVAGSATDRNNYTLNGVGLPDGTVITLDSTRKIASITLPASGSVSADDAAAVFRVIGVQSASGTTVTSKVVTASVYDNTAPVLLSAQVVDAAHIDLTFDESMFDNTGAAVTSEFAIQQNGVALAGATVTANAVTGYSKKVRLTLTGASLDLTKDLTITTKSAATAVKDKSALGNAKKADVTVSITK